MATNTPLFQVGQKVNWILADDFLAFRVMASARQPLKDKKGATQFPAEGKDYIICAVRFQPLGRPSYEHVSESQLIPFQVID